MIILWIVFIWWLIGFLTITIGSALFDKEITVGTVLAAAAMGVFGPFMLIFVFMEIFEKYEKVVLWKKKK